MRRHWRYFVYVVRHKFYVYAEGRKLGLGFFRCLVHDWHKFLPGEWFPYVRNFYRPDGSKKARGEATAAETAAFQAAWERHFRRAPHHWDHYCQDGGPPKEMPDAYRKEMLADWRAMGRAFGEEPPAVGWYEKNRAKMLLHPKTRACVESELARVREA